MEYRIVRVDLQASDEDVTRALDGYDVVSAVFGHDPETLRSCMIYTLAEKPKRGRPKVETKDQ